MPAKRARACPKRPKVQSWRAGMTPAGHAENARLVFFGHVIGANGVEEKERATSSPLND